MDQGSSTLDTVLSQKGIDTLVIGTATNVCCESTIRDGMMSHDTRFIMVSNANASRTDQEHDATLATLTVHFGDERSTDETITMLATGSNA